MFLVWGCGFIKHTPLFGGRMKGFVLVFFVGDGCGLPTLGGACCRVLVQHTSLLLLLWGVVVGCGLLVLWRVVVCIFIFV